MASLKITQMEVYNVAYNYLKNKYGYKRTFLTCSASNKFRKARNNKERKEIEDTFTDRDYNLEINTITEVEDMKIHLLLSQFYYGITVKKELHNLLNSLNIK